MTGDRASPGRRSAVATPAAAYVRMRRVFGRNLDRSTVDGFGVEWSTLRSDRASPRTSCARTSTTTSTSSRGTICRRTPSGSTPAAAAAAGRASWPNGWGPCTVSTPAKTALAVARRRLADRANCRFHHASVDAMPLPDGTHGLRLLAGRAPPRARHRRGRPRLRGQAEAGRAVPAVPVLRPREPPGLVPRRCGGPAIACAGSSRGCPRGRKLLVADVISGSVYWPLARASRAAEALGLPVDNLPLSFYRNGQLLHDADRRPRPLRHAARAAVHRRPDRDDDDRRRPARHPLLRSGAVLVRGRAESCRKEARSP